MRTHKAPKCTPELSTSDHGIDPINVITGKSEFFLCLSVKAISISGDRSPKIQKFTERNIIFIHVI